jgi:2'-5' RNA ligase
MVKTGFEREDRRFSPHLTLARVKYLRARDNWQKALDGVKDIKLPAFAVDHVGLIKSELKPSGAVYTELGKINLK